MAHSTNWSEIAQAGPRAPGAPGLLSGILAGFWIFSPPGGAQGPWESELFEKIKAHAKYGAKCLELSKFHALCSIILEILVLKILQKLVFFKMLISEL